MITLSAPSILLILLAVFLGAIVTLTAVALGAMVVFRTKSPTERLFQAKPETGDAFVVDDYGDGVEDTPVKERDPRADDPVPSIIAKQTERFLQQFREKQEAKG